MSNAKEEKPEMDYESSPAFETDEDGNPRLVMETLSKSGNPDNDQQD